MNIDFLYKYFYMIVEPSSGHLQKKLGLIIFFHLARFHEVQEKTRPCSSPVQNFEWSWDIPNEVIPTGLRLFPTGRASFPRITSRSSHKAPDIVQQLSVSEPELARLLKLFSLNSLKTLIFYPDEEFGDRQGTSSRVQTRMVPSL